MNWFRRLFTQEETLPAIDLGEVQVDMHSHLLPGIDDGAKTLEESITLIRGFKELGYRKVITTPHVMSDFYKNTPDIILSAKKKVKGTLATQRVNIEVEASAEYYLDEFLIHKIESKELLPFGDNYILFELPFIGEPPNLATFVFELQTNGYTPILAHPERYTYWHDNFDKYHEMKDRGVHLQLNMFSLIGYYSPQIKKIAERMIDEGLVSFLGSDCHNEQHLAMMDAVRTRPYLHQLVESGKLLNKTL